MFLYISRGEGGPHDQLNDSEARYCTELDRRFKLTEGGDPGREALPARVLHCWPPSHSTSFQPRTRRSADNDAPLASRYPFLPAKTCETPGRP